MNYPELQERIDELVSQNRLLVELFMSFIEANSSLIEYTIPIIQRDYGNDEVILSMLQKARLANKQVLATLDLPSFHYE